MATRKIKELIPVANELNTVLGLEKKNKIKTVAVKAATLQAAIVEACAAAELDLDELSEETKLVLFDIGAAEEPDEEQESETEEQASDDEGDDEGDDEEEEEPEIPALKEEIWDTALDVAANLVKVLKVTDDKGKNPMPKYKKMDQEELYAEIVEMVGLIGQPYEDEKGKEVQPKETQKDFSEETVAFIEAAGLEVNWPKEEPETKGKEGKGKGNKDTKTKSTGKKDNNSKSVTRNKGRYGQRLGSMSNAVDDMLWKGMTAENMIKKIMKDFDKPEKNATERVRGHIKRLMNENVVPIDYDEKKDFYKATKETV